MREGQVIPGSEAIAENIKKTVEELAQKIGRYSASGVIAEYAKLGTEKPTSIGLIVEIEAQKVLLDWFLGRDNLDEGSESNTRAQAP